MENGVKVVLNSEENLNYQGVSKKNGSSPLGIFLASGKIIPGKQYCLPVEMPKWRHYFQRWLYNRRRILCALRLFFIDRYGDKA